MVFSKLFDKLETMWPIFSPQWECVSWLLLLDQFTFVGVVLQILKIPKSTDNGIISMEILPPLPYPSVGVHIVQIIRYTNSWEWCVPAWWLHSALPGGKAGRRNFVAMINIFLIAGDWFHIEQTETLISLGSLSSSKSLFSEALKAKLTDLVMFVSEES